MRYANVVAPDDGVTSARSASLGGGGSKQSGVVSSDPPAAARMAWRSTAMQLADIVEGQRVEPSLPDGGSATARVCQTAPALDERSRMGMLYADITRPKSTRAGMYAAGRIVLTHRPAMVVPAASVVIRDGSSFVYKV